MGWRIFKATDTGAPSAALNVQGSLAAILRACLIDGYGTTLPVGGWSEPFAESGGVSVFRADTGNRQFYQFADTAGAYAVIKAYESMSDLTTGAGEWTNNDYYFGKYYATSNMDWIVVANEVTVIFVGIGQHGWVPQMFGEYEALFSGTSYNNAIIGAYSTSLRETLSSFGNFYDAYSSAGSSTGKRVVMHRLPNGNGVGFAVGLCSFSGALGGAISYNYTISLALTAQIKPVLTPVFYYGAPDTTAVPSGEDYYYAMLPWGVVPLILAMNIPVADFSSAINATSEWTDTDTGLSYLLLPYGLTTYTTYDRVAFAIPLADVS